MNSCSVYLINLSFGIVIVAVVILWICFFLFSFVFYATDLSHVRESTIYTRRIYFVELIF